MIGKRILAVVALVLLMLSAYPCAVQADTGPKPTVEIEFQNIGEGTLYATLLAEGYYGPGFNQSTWDELPEEVATAFKQYEEADAFVIERTVWTLTSEDNLLRQGYYAPNVFKVVVYDPEQKQFRESAICKRNSLVGHYTVDLGQIDAEGHLVVNARPCNPLDILLSWSFVARMLLTVAIELGLALAFGFRDRKSIIVIIAANIITQILLNVGLNTYVYYYSMGALYILLYLGAEILVTATEAAAYCTILKGKQSMGKTIGYACVANVVTFGLGVMIGIIMRLN